MDLHICGNTLPPPPLGHRNRSNLLVVMTPAVPHPDPQCTISDDDPPTNVRTQPNGLIIGNLHNGDAIRIVDQTRALMPGRWPVGGLWDFVFVAGEGGGLNSPYGWVYDELVRCH